MVLEETFKDWVKIINLPLLYKILSQIDSTNICPKQENVFKAFTLCPFNECKVIFLGMDPYPQKDKATGILFANKVTDKVLSPSLEVVKESCIGYDIPQYNPIVFDTTLESWAKQGILMLNSALTCEVNKTGSHMLLWRPFITNLIESLNKNTSGLVYVLFGSQAQSFEPYIDSKTNYIIKEKHPAYYARLGERMPSNVFQEVNQILVGLYGSDIKWYEEQKC